MDGPSAAADVLVRNSRFPDGPVLRLAAGEMAGFLHAIKAGEFDELLAPVPGGHPAADGSPAAS